MYSGHFNAILRTHTRGVYVSGPSCRVLMFVAFIFIFQYSWAGQKVCLTISFPASDLKGVKNDLQNYKKIAEANDCRKVEISRDFFTKNAPKEKALGMLKRQLGDADDILLMYSGHGVCIGDEETSRKSTSASAQRGYTYRLAGVTKKQDTKKVVEEEASRAPTLFGMVYGDYDACMATCDGENRKACERTCGFQHTLNDEDLGLLFKGKKLTTIIDACGSGCQNNDFLKAQPLHSATSARGAESTHDTPEGGILNVRLKEAFKTKEACHMDKDSDGKISFTEMSSYMSNYKNALFPDSWEGDSLVKATQAVFPRSTGGKSSFTFGTYSPDACNNGSSGSDGTSGGTK